jgi:hypothetical protein
MRLTHALDQAGAVEHGGDGADGRDPDVPSPAAHQDLADRAGAPVRLLALEVDDQALDWAGELVGVAHGPP